MIVRREGGFTLVELMVAIAITAIVVAGIATTFQSQVSSMHAQESIADLQISGSLVLMKLAQDARMAGYGIPKDNTVGAPPAITAFANDNTAADNTDTVTIRYCAGASGYYYGSTPTTTLTLSDNGFVAGDTVKVLNLRREDVFPGSAVTVTAVSGNTVTLSSNLTTDTAIPTDLGVFVGSGVADIRYDIANPGTDNVYLRRTVTSVGGAAQSSEIVAFGVEDLQVAYGVDEDSNGAVESWVHAPTATGPAAQLPRVIALRVSIIIRSSKEDDGATSGVLQAEDGISRGGSDRYKRRIFSTTVRLRNASVI